MKLTLALPSLVAGFLAAAALALPAGSTLAAGPKLTIPDFSHLRGKATDSVDVTIDGMLLRLAKHFAKKEDGEELDFLSDIKSVRVRNFSFDSDDAYSREDIDSVRRQLSGPGWSALVQAHKRDPQEDVDVFICVDGDKVLGLAVIAAEPREFTIVNIIGSIDIDKIAKLEGQFGIPKMSITD